MGVHWKARIKDGGTSPTWGSRGPLFLLTGVSPLITTKDRYVIVLPSPVPPRQVSSEVLSGQRYLRHKKLRVYGSTLETKHKGFWCLCTSKDRSPRAVVSTPRKVEIMSVARSTSAWASLGVRNGPEDEWRLTVDLFSTEVERRQEGRTSLDVSSHFTYVALHRPWKEVKVVSL